MGKLVVGVTRFLLSSAVGLVFPALALVLFSIVGLTACGGGGGGGGDGSGSPAPIPPPGPPSTTVVLSFNPKSIIAGQSTTLSWSSTNATACTASGGWSGSKLTSGSEIITQNKLGPTTYTLACTGAQGTDSASAILTIQATMDANPTFTVLSTQGWQEMPVVFSPSQIGRQFHIAYVSGQWTVDFRNFPKVGIAGYPPATDRQIFQGCKINSSWPYGALLGAIGSAGTLFTSPLLLDHEGTYTVPQIPRSGSLYLRIHDADQCLVDNDGAVRVQVSNVPDSAPSNLIVLVHGCCTDENAVVADWGFSQNPQNPPQTGSPGLAMAIADNILLPEAWQIVVWDWSAYTPDLDFLAAYNEAPNQGHDLATSILKRSYNYIHLVGHSAGSRLIQQAATDLISNNTIRQNNPFIHLTFLDAYTPNDADTNSYGDLGNYTSHYSEHYVDRTDAGACPIAFASTNSILPHAFNYDVTACREDNSAQRGTCGHLWPVSWYKKSSIATPPTTPQTPEYKYGYPLSRESGNNLSVTLAGKTGFLKLQGTDCQ